MSCQSLVLASRSPIRAHLLREAGVQIDIRPASVDEATLRDTMIAEGLKPRDIADTLADMKARRVANKAPSEVVLGADQVLACDGRLFEKPRNGLDAADQLRALRGRTHELLSAAVVYDGTQPVWRHIGRAQLSMRPFSDAYLEGYLARVGDTVLGSVGAYKFEGEGVQLFERMTGDYFSVLGLPLLEILAYLRRRGLMLE